MIKWLMIYAKIVTCGLNSIENNYVSKQPIPAINNWGTGRGMML